MLIAALAAAPACRSRAPAATNEPLRPVQPLPAIEGTLAVEGLGAPVRIVRDRWGIPHITAQSQDDVFFAQGFVQAQDRLFQMDLWRRAAQGRLAEVLGANFIERDAMTRRVQYRGSIEAEWASYGREAKAVAVAFTRGVNAWVAMARDNVPEEFTLAGWLPEPWHAEDLLTRTDAFLASRGVEEEMLRLGLVREVGLAAARRYLPGDVPSSLHVDPGLVNERVGEMLRRVGAPPFFAGLAAPIVGRLRLDRPVDDPPISSVVPRVAPGSAWASAPGKTGSSRAVLASSWVTALNHPSARYVVHLNAPGWQVAGVTAPWRPGVAAGHNDRIAWTFVESPVDTQTLIVERLNPRNPLEYATPSGWRRLERASAAIAVKGRAEPFAYEQQFTVHGTVMAIDRERHLAYAVAWPGSEPGTAAELGAIAIGRARSWSELDAALASWKTPIAEFVFADTTGRIGRRTAGLVPAAGSGGAAGLPRAGWLSPSARRRWSAYTEPASKPGSIDFLVASPGHDGRRRRLEMLLTTSPRVAVEESARMLRDVVSTHAERLVPLLAHIEGVSPVVDVARQRLLAWDRLMSPDSAEAQLYSAWERAIVTSLAESRVPGPLAVALVDRLTSHLVDAVEHATPGWFEHGSARDRLLVDALAQAIDRVARPVDAKAVGAGQPQQVWFTHPLAVSADARRRFNVGPFRPSGSPDAIAAYGRTARGRPGAPTVRLILDVGDWDQSRVGIVPGQSEAPDSPHFSDFADRSAAEVPLLFSERAVAGAAESTLTLVPR